MSVIGPRPQLVRDMVFMTDEQRMRHTAKPGLSGLAQVNGRNAITWEDKLEWDQKYIKKVGLIEDINIILETVKKAFIKQEGISQDDMAKGIINEIDSCTLMAHHGAKMHVVNGDYGNIKITTPEDFYTFRAIYDVKENDVVS